LEQEAAKKAEQEASPFEGRAVHNAFRKDDRHKHEAVRRKISLWCGAAFVLLLSILMASDGLTQPILQREKAFNGSNDGRCQNKQLTDDWITYQNDKAQVAYTLLRRQPTVGDTNQWRPPFLSDRPGADSLSELSYQQLVVRAQEQQRQSDQALSSANMDVERYQKAIEFSQKRLAELALILADPTISMRDRQFAVSGQATQLKFLQESLENLKYAQQRFNELQRTGGGGTA
jgi:hypothetical protein